MKVTIVCRNQIKPKLTKRRTVAMSEMARDRSWPDCQLS